MELHPDRRAAGTVTSRPVKRTCYFLATPNRAFRGTDRGFRSPLVVHERECGRRLLDAVAAGVLALSIAFYVFVYTMWLKRRTPQNIVIGGAAGAFPPVIGWAAVTGSVDAMPLLLFAIVFFGLFGGFVLGSEPVQPPLPLAGAVSRPPVPPQW